MFDRLSHIMLFASDVQRAIKWYTGKLGFEVVYQAGKDFVRLRHPGMDCGLSLHVVEEGSSYIGRGPIPYFATRDFDFVYKQLRMAGVECGEPRSEGNSPRFVSFTDSEGNHLGLTETR